MKYFDRQTQQNITTRTDEMHPMMIICTRETGVETKVNSVEFASLIRQGKMVALG